MFIFIGKVILLYFLTITIIRLMGKSAFAQLTAHDLAGIFFVISLAAGPIVSDSFSYTITGLVVVGFLHILVSRLMLINWINRLFTGKPTIVIKDGKLIKKNLKSSQFTLSEVLSEVRENGYPDITDIDYAIIEPNGGISVIPKPEAAPVTPGQLGIETTFHGLPIAVIVEGKIQHGNLKELFKDENWLKKELERTGCQQRDIFYAAVRDNNKLTVDTGDGHLYNT